MAEVGHTARMRLLSEIRGSLRQRASRLVQNTCPVCRVDGPFRRDVKTDTELKSMQVWNCSFVYIFVAFISVYHKAVALWCLRRIFHIHWTDLVSNDIVRSRTGQPLLSDTIRQRRLSFFGHLRHADTGQDHSRALRACIRGPPKDCRRTTGRPRQTWLRTIEDDLRPLNFSLATARQRVIDRPAWRLLVDAATSL